MKQQWESRERRTKHIALILSVVLHVAALAVFAGSRGDGQGVMSQLIETVFGKGDDTQKDTAQKT